ncbi:Cleavage-polyadenylation specificity factor subunit 5 [Babesia duncani]|uniref:Cleavage-polyadenylation specificity factor subunit 5 n=1 Tax=Babesia duncani TaxID=323732 RepID=A0AAD9UP24_9APIC|nr:Cleavage-polyadenylation specificity factor subunit 5 [Babesia duncani]
MSDSAQVIDSLQRPEWVLYEESSYKFDTSDSTSVGCLTLSLDSEIASRRLLSFSRNGMRTSAFGLVLCHIKGFPHAILVRNAATESLGFLGGKCKSYMDPKEELLTKLMRFVPAKGTLPHQLDMKKTRESIAIGEFLAEMWRIDLESNLLPYLPVHVNRPIERTKECQENQGRFKCVAYEGNEPLCDEMSTGTFPPGYTCFTSCGQVSCPPPFSAPLPANDIKVRVLRLLCMSSLPIAPMDIVFDVRSPRILKIKTLGLEI